MSFGLINCEYIFVGKPLTNRYWLLPRDIFFKPKYTYSDKPAFQKEKKKPLAVVCRTLELKSGILVNFGSPSRIPFNFELEFLKK